MPIVIICKNKCNITTFIEIEHDQFSYGEGIGKEFKIQHRVSTDYVDKKDKPHITHAYQILDLAQIH